MRASSLTLFALASVSTALVHPRFAERASGSAQVLKAYAELTGPAPRNVKAHFEFTGYSDGRATDVRVTVDGGLTNDASLGDLGGPYGFHVHTNAIAAGATCATAFGHLDPLNVTESIACNKLFPQFCQAGDLSGKHGKINGTANGKVATFTLSDEFVRFFPQRDSILGRSVVIHSANKTRLACGNIISTLDGTADKSGKPTNKPSTYQVKYPALPPVQPAVLVNPFANNTYPSKAFLTTMPYPLPLHGISLKESLNVKFETIQREVYILGKKTKVKQTKELAALGKGPFFEKH